MFILPSRGRPSNLLRLRDAWVKTGASTRVEICVDSDDPCAKQYKDIETPQGWRIVISQRDRLSVIYNESYQRHPHEPWYGFIADDVVPITNGWDIKLIEAAGSDGMAVPSGGETTGGCPHFVLGGDLVRSMGWLSLPGLDRLFIDTVWKDVAAKLGVLRHVPDVTLEHRHFSNGKAPMDSVYRKYHKAQDKLIYNNWRQQHADLP